MRYPEQKELILKGYFYLQTDNAYVSLQKALYAEERHNIKEAENISKSSPGTVLLVLCIRQWNLQRERDVR